MSHFALTYVSCGLVVALIAIMWQRLGRDERPDAIVCLVAIAVCAVAWLPLLIVAGGLKDGEFKE